MIAAGRTLDEALCVDRTCQHADDADGSSRSLGSQRSCGAVDLD